MEFRTLKPSDYLLVCDFLVELNQSNRTHINWNWARFEWMYYHPGFNKSEQHRIGLWLDGDHLVGLAIYDMYFGEANCLVLPEYETLYPEVVEYALDQLKDENGLGISINDQDGKSIAILEGMGFALAEQKESILSARLDHRFDDALPDGFSYAELDPVKEPYEFQWLLYQGFDHGDDKAAFEQEIVQIPRNRDRFDLRLSLSIITESGEKVAYCCLWFDPRTDYAYLEPLCVIPAYRGRGLATSLVHHLLNIARGLGARTAYVISDQPFYYKAGFAKDQQYTFYWKRP